MEQEPEYKVINLMEEIVVLKVDMAMNESGVCNCQLCRADVLAYALNHLPPKYAVTSGGNVFGHMITSSLQMQAEIMVAITEGIEMVQKHPRH